MITSLAYDSAGCRATVEPRNGVHTMVFQSDGQFFLAQTPFDPSPPLGLVLRLLSLRDGVERKWKTYCALLVHNDWSRGQFRTAAYFACSRYWLPKSSVEDVMQEAQLALCRLLAAKVDVIAWLKKFFPDGVDRSAITTSVEWPGYGKASPLERFVSWFGKFLFNVSSAAARKNVPRHAA